MDTELASKAVADQQQLVAELYKLIALATRLIEGLSGADHFYLRKEWAQALRDVEDKLK